MARRPTQKQVLNDDIEIENVSAPQTSDDENSAPRKTIPPERLMSVKQLSSYLNRDRNTVQKWLDQGCPFVTKADRNLGISWELDIAEVVKWREKVAATDAVEKSGGANADATSEDEAKRRRAVANAVVAELDMLERLRAVIPLDDVLDAWAKDYAEIKGKLMSLPDALAGNVEVSIAGKIRKIADKHVRSILDGMKTKDTLLKTE